MSGSRGHPRDHGWRNGQVRPIVLGCAIGVSLAADNFRRVGTRRSWRRFHPSRHGPFRARLGPFAGQGSEGASARRVRAARLHSGETFDERRELYEVGLGRGFRVGRGRGAGPSRREVDTGGSPLRPPRGADRGLRELVAGPPLHGSRRQRPLNRREESSPPRPLQFAGTIAAITGSPNNLPDAIPGQVVRLFSFSGPLRMTSAQGPPRFPPSSTASRSRPNTCSATARSR